MEHHWRHTRRWNQECQEEASETLLSLKDRLQPTSCYSCSSNSSRERKQDEEQNIRQGHTKKGRWSLIWLEGRGQVKYVISFPSIFPFYVTEQNLTKEENLTQCKAISTQGCLVSAIEIPSTGMYVKSSVPSVVPFKTVDTFKKLPYVVETSWV